MQIPKNPRHEDKKWLILQREFPCIFTCKRNVVEVDHLNKFTGRGTGYKSHDYWTNPIWFEIHREKDTHGELTTFSKYMNLNAQTMMDTLKAYGELRYLRWLAQTDRDDEALVILKKGNYEG